jgi:hypothetical protein
VVKPGQQQHIDIQSAITKDYQSSTLLTAAIFDLQSLWLGLVSSDY